MAALPASGTGRSGDLLVVFFRQGAAPEAFQIVEMAGFVPEQMDDNITGIDQHPVRLAAALGNIADHTSRLQAFEHMLRHGLDMPSGTPGGNHHGVGKAGFSGEIDGDRIDCLVIG